MPEHRRKIILPVVVVLLLVAAVGAYYWFSQEAGSDPGVIRASGVVEAVEVSVAAELTGRVVEVLAQKGDPVSQGQLLIRLDDTLLQAQRAQMEAALEFAKASTNTAHAAAATAALQYQLALDAARLADSPSRSKSWSTPMPGDFDQPGWYFDAEEQRTAMEAEVRSAELALTDAKANLERVESNPALRGILRAEERLAQARVAYLVAKDVLDRAQAASSRKELLDFAQDLFDHAKEDLEDAQKLYDDLLNTDQAEDLLKARARVAAAQERYFSALDRLARMRTGEESLSVQIAAAILLQADLAAEQADRGVETAQVQMDALDAQIGKLSVYAPVDGVVLQRNVEPGEVMLAGSSALVLGQLDALTLTVFVSEDRYGEIRLGQTATVKVDSFPGEVFRAAVVHVADKAEFTPRNVQTDEGRKTTVFAVELSVPDENGKLRPGMPADVVFE